MIGSSRTSLSVVQETVTGRFREPALGDAGRDLLEVADLLVREKLLRNSLGDSGRSVAERRALVASLLEGRISSLALDFISTIVAQRWSSDSDLVDAVEFAAAQSLFGASEDAGDLDQVEEEFFRFSRILSSDGELQLTLSSPSLPAVTKRAILADLLEGKARATTIELLSYITTHLRGRRVDAAIGMLTKLAAERRGKLLAVVRSARDLSVEQQARLSAALERIYSQPIAINIAIDPALLGGLIVQIGDDVIDGSISNRLDKARRRVAG
jgi:F-type H+-transporting ATPase subunit delta